MLVLLQVLLLLLLLLCTLPQRLALFAELGQLSLVEVKVAAEVVLK
jgi:hypothetical protein